MFSTLRSLGRTSSLTMAHGRRMQQYWLHQTPCRRTIDPAQWSKSSLMRLRKNQLEELAREHKLTPTGTKLEIVQRLLHQRNDSNPSWATDDTAEQRVEEAVATEHSHEDKQQEEGSRTLLEESIGPDMGGVVDEEQGHHDKSLDALQDLEAANWVEAFELKAGHTHLRQRSKAPNMFTAAAAAAASRAPNNGDHATQTSTAASRPSSPQLTTTNEPMPEDVNEQWVRAFEQKVGSRKSRQSILGTDTFTPTDIELSGLDFIESTTGKDPARVLATEDTPLNDQVQQSIGFSKTDVPDNTANTNTTTTDSNSASRNNMVITSLIGSGLLVWVAGGEKGFKQLADILMSSS